MVGPTESTIPSCSAVEVADCRHLGAIFSGTKCFLNGMVLAAKSNRNQELKNHHGNRQQGSRYLFTSSTASELYCIIELEMPQLMT